MQDLVSWFDVQNNSMFRDDHLICFHFNLLLFYYVKCAWSEKYTIYNTTDFY
jgi:hypothetical protein